MGPSRKRARTKPPSGSANREESASAAADKTNISSTKDDTPTPLKTPAKNIKACDSSPKEVKPKNSWYGTWPRKSMASTQVARETILADKPTNGQPSTDLSRFEPRKAPVTAEIPHSMVLGKSREVLDITMGGTIEAETREGNETHSNEALVPGVASKTESIKDIEEHSQLVQTQPEPNRTQRPMTASSWLGGWIGRPATQAPNTSGERSSEMKTSKEPSSTDVQVSQPESEPEPPAAPVPPQALSEPTTASAVSTSWFGLWSTAAPSRAAEASKEQIPIKLAENDKDTIMEDAPAPKRNAEVATGSSWAFWTTETTKKEATPAEESRDSGKLAVAGEASQSIPVPAQAAVVNDGKTGKSAKRGRPQSVEVDEGSKTLRQSDTSLATVVAPQSPAPSKTSPPNLLLPSVRSTYRLVENPSILQQLTRLILHSQQQASKHVFLVKEPPKIKKALAIGIHGLFPAPLLRTVIGQPTGTSIRFANHAAAAIRRWCDLHGCIDCEIEKVALEGEGKIADRVDNLWKLLLNWIDHVRQADFILVACHSQGVPVALMLVAKLIEFGVVSTGRIGVCAMAGISLGPFADYKSRLFSGSAGELFEFADPESAVSKRYEDSLRVAVKYGVRVTYCGSIDDQLVSMESSIFSTLTHPYIFRAVFVDGRIHAPNFLSHLIGFALKLRNLGVSDHGLIRELSAPLAGSLYTGEGHSRLYDEEKVYDLAIEYALETTFVGDVPLQITKYEIPTNANPYVLPWIMRGLLEEDFVKTELDTEVTELLKQFDEWKPATKVLKDVKYRLEAVRSKL